MKGRVLVIAGSDSGGGAGIQGDIKTITCLGGYAATAITALTAQNTLGVHGIHDVPEDFIALQIHVVLEDIGADCIKIGMLHKHSVIETVATTLEKSAAHIPIVLDPVMVAKGGHALLEPDAIEMLKTRLIPRATIVTPNIPEAEHLSGVAINDKTTMKEAGAKLLALGCDSVLLKGGHIQAEKLTDILFTPNGTHEFEAQRIDTPHTHGTGCTMASAIAASFAQGDAVYDAVEKAHTYVQAAIKASPKLGNGHGPLSHNVIIK